MPPRGLLLLLSAATLVTAQESAQKKQLTARELFYAAVQAPATPASTHSRAPAKRATHTPPKPVEIARAQAPAVDAATHAPAPATAPMPANGAPPLGLRYTVLKLDAGNNPTEVSSDAVFHSGDRIRFSIETNAPGYLYIVNQGSSGTWKVMFPSAEIDDGSNRVEGWHPYTMPPKSRLAFDATAGTENLFIVFSAKQESDLEAMIYSLQGKGKKAGSAPEAPVHSSKELITAVNIPNTTVDRMREVYGRDLIIERVDPGTDGDKKETAVYVVNPTGSADSRVVADLHLVHQ